MFLHIQFNLDDRAVYCVTLRYSIHIHIYFVDFDFFYCLILVVVLIVYYNCCRCCGIYKKIITPSRTTHTTAVCLIPSLAHLQWRHQTQQQNGAAESCKRATMPFPRPAYPSPQTPIACLQSRNRLCFSELEPLIKNLY